MLVRFATAILQKPFQSPKKNSWWQLKHFEKSKPCQYQKLPELLLYHWYGKNKNKKHFWLFNVNNKNVDFKNLCVAFNIGAIGNIHTHGLFRVFKFVFFFTVQKIIKNMCTNLQDFFIQIWNSKILFKRRLKWIFLTLRRFSQFNWLGEEFLLYKSRKLPGCVGSDW